MSDFTLDTPKDEKPKTKSANPSDLSRMLEGYKDVTPVETKPEQSQPSNIPFSKETHYVRGDKKGQLKPKPGMPKASFNPPTQDTTVNAEFIDAAIFLMLIDFILPTAIAAINNRFTEGKKMKVEELQLTDAQKKMMEPVANKLIHEIKITGNPMVLFPIMMIVMYASNFAMLKMLNK